MSNNYVDLDALDAQDAANESPAKAAHRQAKAPAYSRDQILASRRYSMRRDALSVVLKPGKLYTDAQIEEELKNYYKRSVK